MKKSFLNPVIMVMQGYKKLWFFFNLFFVTGVMTAVEVVVENLKKMSKQVSTPEEIAQVSQVNYFMNKLEITPHLRKLLW